MSGSVRLAEYEDKFKESRLQGGTAMIETQELRDRLISIFERSDLLTSLFERAGSLGPYPYYIGAGCLVQTVWNELTGRLAMYGISDIDIVYFDDADLSYEAENEAVERGKRLFTELPLPVDIKNQARVHLWYPGRFGVGLTPYASLEAAIDSWPTTASSLGVRKEPDGSWRIYAPFGLEDLFQLVVRPNKTLVTESAYYAKAEKWKSSWPELTVMPWEA
ncbi:nucleotidyltransferase family protein [Paenibacillus zanthoxyli]|uniref:nucleotidyltransferase family protein n=1 Tax=Paenibacillus zanthoxyli TaxID=369399 RepID=UPI001E44775F|nr:nucleotidyltransferase family protein [Paenibacillus zanthoxyli]